jgi:hypothetical protein
MSDEIERRIQALKEKGDAADRLRSLQDQLLAFQAASVDRRKKEQEESLRNKSATILNELQPFIEAARKKYLLFGGGIHGELSTDFPNLLLYLKPVKQGLDYLSEKYPHHPSGSKRGRLFGKDLGQRRVVVHYGANGNEFRATYQAQVELLPEPQTSACSSWLFLETRVFKTQAELVAHLKDKIAESVAFDRAARSGKAIPGTLASLFLILSGAQQQTQPQEAAAPFEARL